MGAWNPLANMELQPSISEAAAQGSLTWATWALKPKDTRSNAGNEARGVECGLGGYYNDYSLPFWWESTPPLGQGMMVRAEAFLR